MESVKKNIFKNKSQRILSLTLFLFLLKLPLSVFAGGMLSLSMVPNLIASTVSGATLSGTTISAMNVSGATVGTTAYSGNVTVTFTNSGSGVVKITSTMDNTLVASSANFEYVAGGTCTTNGLVQPGATCTILIRSKATDNGSLSGTFSLKWE